MALYRNIAGINSCCGGQVGLTFTDLYKQDQQSVDTIFNPDPVTTGGPYLLSDDINPALTTATIDPGATISQPTDIPQPSTTETNGTNGTNGGLPITKQNILPLLALAGLVAASVTELFPKRRGLVFGASLGALFYGMARNKTT